MSSVKTLGYFTDVFKGIAVMLESITHEKEGVLLLGNSTITLIGVSLEKGEVRVIKGQKPLLSLPLLGLAEVDEGEARRTSQLSISGRTFLRALRAKDQNAVLLGVRCNGDQEEQFVWLVNS